MVQTGMLRSAVRALFMEGFRFEILWNDNDIFQLRIRAWNGKFGGTADVYVPIGAIAEAAERV